MHILDEDFAGLENLGFAKMCASCVTSFRMEREPSSEILVVFKLPTLPRRNQSYQKHQVIA